MKVVNTDGTPAAPTQEELMKQLGEPRALPTGRAEFEEWATRILSGVTFTADKRSLRFALAQMLMQLGPVEAYKPDAYFIRALHVAATKQVGFEIGNELKLEAQNELKNQQDEQKKAAAASKQSRKFAKKFKPEATQGKDVAQKQ